MLLRLFIILLIVTGSLNGKSILTRKISDCSITEDGIIHYYGKYSFTRFENECLSWNDLQLIHSDIINEANFFNDQSIKAAKNYCRNPNMNINGPWCFIQSENGLTMEQCDVCQSLTQKSTVPTDIGSIDDTTNADNNNNGFFDNLRNKIKRFGVYIRDKFWEIIEGIGNKFKQIG